MKLDKHFLLGMALILSGCGSSSSDSGSDAKSCSNLKIFDGNLYSFSKGDAEYGRPAEPEDYEKYCEVSKLPPCCVDY